MEVANAATEKGLEVVIDTEKEYGVYELGDMPLNPSFIFPLPVEESDVDSLISYM